MLCILCMTYKARHYVEKAKSQPFSGTSEIIIEEHACIARTTEGSVPKQKQ